MGDPAAPAFEPATRRPSASPAQARLESLVLEQLGTSPGLCAHPFGIASLTSTGTSLTPHLDPYMSEERYSFPEHCLSRLLPATPSPGSGGDVPGIPGLRVSGIEFGGRQLHLHMVKAPGQAATLVLVLPRGLAEGWVDIECRHRHWYEDNGLRPLWTTPHLDPVEADYLNAYPLTERSRARGASVGSALLRRIALFHTVTAFYRVQCWDDGDSWKIDARTAHPRALWHDQLLQRLCHPRWGLPVRVAHRFSHCAEPDAPYQRGHTCAFYFDGHDEDDPLMTDSPEWSQRRAARSRIWAAGSFGEALKSKPSRVACCSNLGVMRARRNLDKGWAGGARTGAVRAIGCGAPGAHVRTGHRRMVRTGCGGRRRGARQGGVHRHPVHTTVEPTHWPPSGGLHSVASTRCSPSYW